MSKHDLKIVLMMPFAILLLLIFFVGMPLWNKIGLTKLVFGKLTYFWMVGNNPSKKAD